jgi:hypothetical protein
MPRKFIQIAFIMIPPMSGQSRRNIAPTPFCLASRTMARAGCCAPQAKALGTRYGCWTLTLKQRGDFLLSGVCPT